MAEVRIRSIADPFDGPAADPELIRSAVDTISMADAMGLLTEAEPVERLDLPTIRRVAKAAREQGIGATAVALIDRTPSGDADRLREAMDALREALRASPVPAAEWRSLLSLFGADRLALLTRVAPASLRRYASGGRATPDHVAARLHFLAMVVGDLKGAYNDIGIRRWFERKRTGLGNRSPMQLLSPGWDPEASGPKRVAALARSLSGSPAT